MINLDNASTTKPFIEVSNAIFSALNEDYLNMGAKYKQAKLIEKKVDLIRERFIGLLGAIEGELVFTPSATAANNLFFKSINPKSKGKILVGGGEHSSVYECAKNLSVLGAAVEFIPLDATGKIDIEAFKNMLSTDTIFVSVIHVSNETGAINDIKEITRFAKKANPKCIVHSDGVQAFGKIKVNLKELGVDFYTISAHKINGPKGIGALYCKTTKSLKPLILGGGQEKGFVSGTENFPYISGFYTAAKLKLNNFESDYDKVSKDKKCLVDCLNRRAVNFKVNGDAATSSPYIINIAFNNVRGEVMLHALAESDILVATGSACSSKKRGNRTLEAMGLNPSEVDGALRFSFSAIENYNFDFIADKIKQVIDDLSK